MEGGECVEERNYEQRREKLLDMLKNKRLKSLQNELEDMNEFDIAPRWERTTR